MPALYATVERLSDALAAKSTAYNETDLRRALAAGSADVDDVVQWSPGCFRPERAVRTFEWPPDQTSEYYRLWLDGNPLISVETLASGGAILSPSTYYLEPQRYGPPYRRVEINRGTSAAFSYTAGTPQRAVTILGLWGIADDREDAGTLVGTIGAADTVAACSDGSKIGTGDHIVIGTERIEIVGKTWTDTGATLTGGLDGKPSATVLPIASPSAVNVGERVLVDGERMLVTDVSPGAATVKRAQDGTVLAAHLVGASVYARRGLLVTRAARGTIAAGHTDGAAISRHVVPGDVESLAIASAIVTHLGEQAGYSKGGSGTGESKGNPPGAGLEDLRSRVTANYGRQMRIRAI